MNEEKVFYVDDLVKVTNSRFIVPGQTYVMSSVSSVKASFYSPSKWTPVLPVIVGSLAIWFGFDQIHTSDGVEGLGFACMAFGLLIIAWGAYLRLSIKATYWVLLTTSGGEQRALSSKDKDYILKIVNAINLAVVHRG